MCKVEVEDAAKTRVILQKAIYTCGVPPSDNLARNARAQSPTISRVVPIKERRCCLICVRQYTEPDLPAGARTVLAETQN